MIIDLKDDEGALIFRADGSTEFMIPNMKPRDKVPDHIMLLSAIACRCKEPDFIEDMQEWFAGIANN